MSGTDDAAPVTGTPSDNLDNLSDLNTAAWHALMGMSVNWENDIIELLESDEPIHHWVRATLANLIAGKSELGLTLKMSGHKSLRDATNAVQSRRHWVRIGNWIASMTDGGSTRHKAIESASNVHGQSWELCDKAYDYRNRYRRWRDALTDDHPFFECLSEDGIENMFHQMIQRNQPLDGPDGLELAREIIAECFGQQSAECRST
jgi:hypothetical protein